MVIRDASDLRQSLSDGLDARAPFMILKERAASSDLFTLLAMMTPLY